MVQERTKRGLTGTLGLACVLGGALQAGVPLAIVAMFLPDQAVPSLAVAAGYLVASMLWTLLLAAGAVGLYYRHRDVFEWPGLIGTVLVVVGFLASLLGGPLVSGDLASGNVVVWMLVQPDVLGALLLGAAVARADELPHAEAGGLLLALAKPVSFGLTYLFFASFGLFAGDMLAMTTRTLPYGAAWVLLGYDLVTEPDWDEPAAGSGSPEREGHGAR